ncbi:MAG: phasin family protein [Magnetospirillum sp.]|nr:phasin family protein [Magnetospirillum sp.]
MASRKAETGGESASRMATQGISNVTEFGRRSTDQMQQFVTAGARAYRDITDVSKDDVDAIMQTGAKLAKGMQDMTWEVMQYSQHSLRLGMRTANDLMGCRSMEDMMQLGREFMRESVDTFLQESARLLEMSSNVATEAVHPIKEKIDQSGTRH